MNPNRTPRLLAASLLTASLLTAALLPVAHAQDMAAPAVPPTTQSAPSAAPGTPVRTQVKAGTLLGREQGGVRVWQGVPYAAPPVGDRRWRAPQPAPIWVGERDASRPGNVCLQRSTVGNSLARGSEDCLYLNVNAPANASLGSASSGNASSGSASSGSASSEGGRRAPVMVWIHGGSFRSGAGSDYDGRVLAREQGVVVVTLNYRLGPLGFLAAPGLLEGRTAGNYGLLDQQAALRWVRDNIAAFGGDPANVTVFGESAGGMSICDQFASPGAAGLFDKAIIQSGACTPGVVVRPLADALRTGAAYARNLNCPENDAACLRAVPAERLLTAEVPGRSFIGFPPVHGDAALPRSPQEAFQSGQFNRVPTLIGSNLDEGTLFVAPFGANGRDIPLWQFWLLVGQLEGWNTLRVLANYPTREYPTVGLTAAALVTDSVFSCPTNALARDLARVTPVYSYEFRDRDAPIQLRPTATIPDYGAYHAGEIVSVFGTPLTGLASPTQFTPAQAALARQMRAYWANFARTGNPNAAGLTQWQALDPARGNVLALEPGRVAEFTSFRQQHRCDLWSR